MYTFAMKLRAGGRGAVSLASLLGALGAALLAAFAGGIYFSGRFASSKPEPVRAAPPVPAPAPARAGAVADFVLEDQNGERVSLRKAAGHRPMLLYIFSPSCGHCSLRLKDFAKFVPAKLPSGMALVGVLWQGTPAAARKYLAGTGLPGPLLSDRDGDVCGSLGVGEFTAFVLDKQLTVRYRGEMDGLEAALAPFAR